MVPEEWPISLPPACEPANPAPVAGGDRLSAVMADFFLDPAQRLKEQERALIGTLLDDLIAWIADEVGSGLPAEATAANDTDGHALRQKLCSAGLLQRPDLMAVLLHAADEERIAAAVRSRFPGSPSFLQKLISSPNAEVSAAAMELILARGRRRDRFGQPRLDFEDLPERVGAGLAYAVAAALRDTTSAAGMDAAVDRDLSDAATALLKRRDHGKAIGELTRVLITALAESAMLDEDLLGAALREGDIRIVSQGLAQLASIDSDSAWNLLAGGRADGAVLLLRTAGASRPFAAQLIATIGDQLGLTDPATAIHAFESLGAERIEPIRAWMQMDSAYRAAADRLQRHG